MSAGDQNAVKAVRTDTLSIAYQELGPPDGWPVILSHGFPYDVHAYVEVAPALASAGARVIVPYTRGFGPTRFITDSSMRNGQQADRGLDILSLSNGLELEQPILAGFDWGGNASCVAAVLWPEKFSGLVSYAGYDIIDVSQQRHASPPSLERVAWYQHLFQSERGRECLAAHRQDLCRILWEEWSPTWPFDQETFDRSAPAFENPDFVDVVIHCYRWSLGSEPGDPALAPLEAKLATKPPVILPTVTIDGSNDPLKPDGTADHAPLFLGKHEHRVVLGGHNIPQERPQDFIDAILKVRAWSSKTRP